jgi:hypothetical protein
VSSYVSPASFVARRIGGSDDELDRSSVCVEGQLGGPTPEASGDIREHWPRRGSRSSSASRGQTPTQKSHSFGSKV